jgi:6,7-dimethyl-8-ribityllumazine synthase
MATPETTPLPLPALDGPTRVLLVAAPFYRAIADDMIAGARAVLDNAGVAHDLLEMPGALEIPTAIRLAARAGRHDGFVALGCVIRGETTHYETVCKDSARGLMLLGVQAGLCIGNGILTCETMAQAQARANPGGMDKGGGAAMACLHLIAAARRFSPDGGTRMAPSTAEVLLASAASLSRTA